MTPRFLFSLIFDVLVLWAGGFGGGGGGGVALNAVAIAGRVFCWVVWVRVWNWNEGLEMLCWRWCSLLNSGSKE